MRQMKSGNWMIYIKNLLIKGQNWNKILKRIQREEGSNPILKYFNTVSYLLFFFCYMSNLFNKIDQRTHTHTSEILF